METEKKFEEMIEELETISRELEKGDLSLDESVAKFEQGIELSKKCSNILENAEKKITMLIKNGEEMQEENFEAE